MFLWKPFLDWLEISTFVFQWLTILYLTKRHQNSAKILSGMKRFVKEIKCLFVWSISPMKVMKLFGCSHLLIWAFMTLFVDKNYIKTHAQYSEMQWHLMLLNIHAKAILDVWMEILPTLFALTVCFSLSMVAISAVTVSTHARIGQKFDPMNLVLIEFY